MVADQIPSSDTNDAAPLRVHILGPLRITGPDGEIGVPQAAHHLLAVLAGAGHNGISREAMAGELWGHARPDSWMSALRNRTTAARKLLGPDTVLSSKGRYQFAPHVRVDSWDLIAHNIEPQDPSNELHFLDGEPLIDIPASELTTAHAQRVREARVALIDQVVRAGRQLSTRGLQSLRIYQRENPLDPAIARLTVHAHLLADQPDHATSVVAGIREATKHADHPPAWLVQLEQTLQPQPVAPPTPSSTVEVRNRLFATAARQENWSLAFEIAMEGLPEASRVEGDPERLALLESIPLTGLEPSLRFSLASALVRQMIYAGREAEARQWSRTSSELAATPREQLLSFITRAVVGDTEDQRAPIPVPEAFEDAPSEIINVRSLQVAVMSHLERASFDQASPLQQRFTELVETSADPYLRWHALLLQSMTKFVNGWFHEATEAATEAFDYASLFGIVDAEIGLIGQLSNARLIDPSLPGIDDYQGKYPTSASSSLSRALQAAAQAQRTGDDSVDKFLETYDYNSRLFFTFAVVNAVAPYVRSPNVRAEIAARLRERTGTASIWGTGVLHLGPVDRTLARVLQDSTQTPALLNDAIDIADQQHSCLWQVICRLDQAAATGEESWRHEAASLAVTPDLKRLLSTYQPWPASAAI